ncbi:MAG TPA: toll/interleukin-1 receptor domain-containing protein [Candidatus Acidoferrum sp.]|jgi:hypothetical protein|nr:toll/interleukin-1 receptor domain-containing protein [Candidatus Acidoferrum sp.]
MPVDRTLVETIESRLAPLGARVYAAEHDNQAGANVHAKIQDAIRRSDLMVVLLTKSGDSSHYVHQEIGYAKRDGKLIIPLVTSDVVRNGIGMLEGTEYIVVDDDPTAALQQLSQRIGQIADFRARQQHDQLVLAGMILVAIGVVLIAMNE